MVKVYRNSSVEWKPSPVAALATSPDGSQVAAARDDGSLEIWRVSPGSVGWHCQLTIHGDPNSTVSSLLWCWSERRGALSGRLFSSSIDGSILEWDLLYLRQKVVLHSIGVSIWQMAAEPNDNPQLNIKQEISSLENGHGSPRTNSGTDDEEDSESEEDNPIELHQIHATDRTRIAIACDDGCVRIYCVSDTEKLMYKRTLPRVSGRALSVTWSPDANRIYSGSSDGFIRCWDAKLAYEIYRITVGHGGLGNGTELCVWSLLALRSGTIVSADSLGSVQFWDGQFGTLLKAHSYHKGDVNALAADPSHSRVFSAGSDGQVILYKLSSDGIGSCDGNFVSDATKKWIYVGYVRAHTHDARALTLALPISHEGDVLTDERVKRRRVNQKPLEFSYLKWAHSGVPLLISAGDDAKLFVYSAKEFTKFAPHDICPAPQRMPMQLALSTVFNQIPLLLIQASRWLDIYRVRVGAVSDINSPPSGGLANTHLVARVKCKASRKIICSAISSSGTSFAYSDHVKPNLFELKSSGPDNSLWTVKKRMLPREFPFAHCMAFSPDSTRLLIAGQDRRIYVVDSGSAEVLHTFMPIRADHGEELPSAEPCITKMFISTNGQWLAAINHLGDIYIFNLQTLSQHWFISRLYGASVTAAGFTPWNNYNVLIISTSSNQLYKLNVELKQLVEWHTFSLPRRYQELPGEVIGLSFSLSSSSIIVYSPRAMCLIDFRMPANEVNGRNNFELCAFRDPVLFVEHLSRDSLLVLDKPWMQVVKTIETQLPVHRHIFGS